MAKNINRIGEIYTTNEGYKIEIIEKVIINKKAKYKVVFKDSNKYVVICDLKEMKNGMIKNPYHKSVLGVGFYGIGEHMAKVNGKNTQEYQAWRDMLRRCYDDKIQLKNTSYIGTKVCEDWLNYQNYAQWHKNNNPNIDGIKFNVDKDVLQQGLEIKIYSPETCIFLPDKINSFMTNNQSKHNTSGLTGVSINTNDKSKWRAQICDFETGKYICIKHNCNTKKEAYELYKEYRAKNSENAKDYLRSLNYLSEDIIQLIK